MFDPQHQMFTSEIWKQKQNKKQLETQVKQALWVHHI